MTEGKAISLRVAQCLPQEHFEIGLTLEGMSNYGSAHGYIQWGHTESPADVVAILKVSELWQFLQGPE